MASDDENQDGTVDPLTSQLIQAPQSSLPAIDQPPGPLPELTSLGLLPSGIYTATLAEVERVFGSTNPRRILLWSKFLDWYAQIQQEHVAVSVFLDGSFTSSKPEPGDIDLVAQLPDPAQLRGVSQNFIDLMHRSKMKLAYELDVLPWHPQVPPKSPSDLIDFFQSVHPKVATELGVGPEFRKGIIRVML